ncbi:hypothetical protein HDV05_001558 [Chytridiales sp. JEL 0842]|nr:hypothetical protein HDV05_001558 [Chytridiales sp. JEL 0842]
MILAYVALNTLDNPSNPTLALTNFTLMHSGGLASLLDRINHEQLIDGEDLANMCQKLWDKDHESLMACVELLCASQQVVCRCGGAAMTRTHESGLKVGTKCKSHVACMMFMQPITPCMLSELESGATLQLDGRVDSDIGDLDIYEALQIPNPSQSGSSQTTLSFNVLQTNASSVQAATNAFSTHNDLSMNSLKPEDLQATMLWQNDFVGLAEFFRSPMEDDMSVMSMAAAAADGENPPLAPVTGQAPQINSSVPLSTDASQPTPPELPPKPRGRGRPPLSATGGERKKPPAKKEPKEPKEPKVPKPPKPPKTTVPKVKKERSTATPQSTPSCTSLSTDRPKTPKQTPATLKKETSASATPKATAEKPPKAKKTPTSAASGTGITKPSKKAEMAAQAASAAATSNSNSTPFANASSLGSAPPLPTSIPGSQCAAPDYINMQLSSFFDAFPKDPFGATSTGAILTPDMLDAETANAALLGIQLDLEIEMAGMGIDLSTSNMIVPGFNTAFFGAQHSSIIAPNDLLSPQQVINVQFSQTPPVTTGAQTFDDNLSKALRMDGIDIDCKSDDLDHLLADTSIATSTSMSLHDLSMERNIPAPMELQLEDLMMDPEELQPPHSSENAVSVPSTSNMTISSSEKAASTDVNDATTDSAATKANKALPKKAPLKTGTIASAKIASSQAPITTLPTPGAPIPPVPADSATGTTARKRGRPRKYPLPAEGEVTKGRRKSIVKEVPVRPMKAIVPKVDCWNGMMFGHGHYHYVNHQNNNTPFSPTASSASCASSTTGSEVCSNASVSTAGRSVGSVSVSSAPGRLERPSTSTMVATTRPLATTNPPMLSKTGLSASIPFGSSLMTSSNNASVPPKKPFVFPRIAPPPHPPSAFTNAIRQPRKGIRGRPSGPAAMAAKAAKQADATPSATGANSPTAHGSVFPKGGIETSRPPQVPAAKSAEINTSMSSQHSQQIHAPLLPPSPLDPARHQQGSMTTHASSPLAHPPSVSSQFGVPCINVDMTQESQDRANPNTPARNHFKAAHPPPIHTTTLPTTSPPALTPTLSLLNLDEQPPYSPSAEKEAQSLAPSPERTVVVETGSTNVASANDTNLMSSGSADNGQADMCGLVMSNVQQEGVSMDGVSPGDDVSMAAPSPGVVEMVWE